MKEINDWTIMIYFGGDNNLSEEMIWALKDIQAWRSSANYKGGIKVCTLLDAGGPPVRIDDDDLFQGGRPVDLKPAGLRLYHQPAIGDAVLQTTVKVREKVDTTNPKEITKVDSVKKTLTDFVTAVMKAKKFRASRYMLVLSGHGSGAIGDFLTGDKRIFGLTIRALGEVLAGVHAPGEKKKPIDILGMDSCQMSMAEVACEVQDSVQYMIGSEGFQPNTGWPYQKVLDLLSDATTAADPGEFAEAIVRAHIEYYLDYASVDLSTDISALNLVYFQNLQGHLKKLTSALQPEDKEWKRKLDVAAPDLSQELKKVLDTKPLWDQYVKEAIILSHWGAQGYKKEQYVDLWDFCRLFYERLDPAKYKELYGACRDIMKVIDPDAYEQIKKSADPKGAIPGKTERFVRISGYSGPQFQHSHGVSLFFPWANLTDAAGITDLQYYQTLRFARDTAWDEFILLYLCAAQREVRTENTTGDNLPSLLNRRTGLFFPKPGRDPEGNSYDKTKLGTAQIESMKNPPIEWKKWFVSPMPAKQQEKTAG